MQQEYTYILLDLDGTVTDSMEGITKSIRYALKHFGIEVNDLNELRKFVGPPLKESLMEFCHFSADQAEEGIRSTGKDSPTRAYTKTPFIPVWNVFCKN